MDDETAIPKLTQDMLTAAIERAEKALWVVANQRCFIVPTPLDDARKTCDRRGRCEIVWALSDGGRKAFDLLLDLRTGEGRLHPWPDNR